MRNRLSYRLEKWLLLWVPVAELGAVLPLFVMMEVWQLQLVMKAAMHKVIAVVEELRARHVLLAPVLVRPVEMVAMYHPVAVINVIPGSCPS